MWGLRFSGLSMYDEAKALFKRGRRLSKNRPPADLHYLKNGGDFFFLASAEEVAAYLSVNIPALHIP
jgi:hypothetical protein